LRGIRILAVDDEADARELLREVLAGRGAEVSVASSAGEALDLLVKERPHVVIADLAMPGEDGYTFMNHVRALPPNAGGIAPALALTAFASAEDRSKAIRAGFQMHVAKPVNPAELVSVVRNLATGGSAPPRSASGEPL
jgi:CheY-like chemotaxis protein